MSNIEDKLPKLGKQMKFETNPFYKKVGKKMYLRPRTNVVIGKRDALVDMETGEVRSETVLAVKKVVDKSQFAKIYASEIGELFKLKRTSINVFIVMMAKMDYENRVYFKYSDKKTFQDLGYKTGRPCLTGIKELIKFDIIARDVREHHYWLNPVIASKGERFSKFIQYELEKEGEMKQGNLFDDETRRKLDAMSEIEQNKYLNDE